jgi:hypothetical protein
MNNRLINTKVAGGGGGCTDIVDNYDPFGGNGVALYQLNGDATDESGNYNGTASNVSYGTGVFGQAGVFNNVGANDSYSIDTNTKSFFGQKQTCSVSAWIKNSSNFASTYGTIFTDYAFTSFNILIWMNSNGTIELYNRYNNANTTITSSGTYNDNQWHHVVGVINTSNNTMQFYIDNVEIGNVSISTNAYSSSDTGTMKVTIGNLYAVHQSVYNSGFIGSIDQVRVFDTALTPLEVESLYTEELCICDGTVDTLDILGDGSCIATYQLDGNANDLSGNYSGTPTDVSYGVGEFDLAGVFNGSSSYIELPTGVRQDNNFTVSMWFKTNSTTVGQSLISFRNGKKLQIDLNNLNVGSASIRVNSGNNIAVDSATGIFVTDTWYHFTLVQSSVTGVTVYLNNSIVASNSGATGNLVTVSGIDVIGSYENSYSYFNGSIDQARFFNKALNSTEVGILYNNETPCN